ncbi:MAG: hypothetical protein QXS76_00230 [Candidatus Bathyarchaeia archaeon]
MRLRSRHRLLLSNLFGILAILFLILYLIRPMMPFDLLKGAKVYEESFPISDAAIIRFQDWRSTGTYGATANGSKSQIMEIQRDEPIPAWVKSSMRRTLHYFNYSFDHAFPILRFPMAIPSDAKPFRYFLSFRISQISGAEIASACSWHIFILNSSFSPRSLGPVWKPSSFDPKGGDFIPARLMIDRLPNARFLGSLSHESFLLGGFEFGPEMGEFLPIGRPFILNISLIPAVSAMPANLEIAIFEPTLAIHYATFGDPPSPTAIQVSILREVFAQRPMLKGEGKGDDRALLGLAGGCALAFLLLRRPFF